MPFDNSTLEEMHLLMQFDSSTMGNGIKVHSNARAEVISASRALFEKGLITQSDGGYLTDAGIEALAHLEALTGLLGSRE